MAISEAELPTEVVGRVVEPIEALDPRVAILQNATESLEAKTEALSQLYTNFAPFVLRIASKIADVNDAEDVAQDAFIKAFRNINSYSPQEGVKFKAWLAKITVNQAYDSRRKPYSKRVSPIESYLEVSDLDIVSAGKTPVLPEIRYEEKRALEIMQDVINNLPACWQGAIKLRAQGMAYEEIAEVLQIPVGTVRSKLNRGRKLLKKMIGVEQEPPLV